MFGDRMGIIWKNESYRVSARFAPAVSPFIRERKWHPKQVIKDNKDGSLTLTFETIHLNEVKDWILSYGPNVKVTEPKVLVDRVRSDLKAAMAAYKQ
jgi:proteasome accessory factor B